MEEDTVGHLVVEWVVNLRDMAVGRPVGHGCDPFPVAVMGEIKEHDDFSLGISGVGLFEIGECHPSHHFLLGHGERLDVLHNVVAEEMIELAFNFLQLFVSFFGEGPLEVFPHDLLPVSDQVVNQGVEEVVGKEIVDTQGHE